MRNDLQYPKIRPVEAFPVQTPEQQGICIRDPKNIATNMLVLPEAVFQMVALFDGQHSVADIQEYFLKRHQAMIPSPQIEAIIEQLDAEFYLESETYHHALETIRQAYLDAPFREAKHAGGAYESDADRLRGQLDGYLSQAEAEVSTNGVTASQRMTLLIAPHIDLHRGGFCFAHAYRELARSEPSDLYVILGTAHQSLDSSFILTKKSYQTPLGLLETNTEFIERFASHIPLDPYQEELLHRDEHSIEFQAVWLKHLLGDDWKGRIVPILCGSFHSLVMKGLSPREDEQIAQSLDALRQTIESYDGTVTVIAGVDLSHVGKRFGHAAGIPPSELKRIEEDDRELLETVCAGDGELFYRTVAKKRDRNNVCGLSPIYIALDVIRPTSGRLLRYEQAIEEDTESVVSFASLSFYAA